MIEIDSTYIACLSMKASNCQPIITMSPPNFSFPLSTNRPCLYMKFGSRKNHDIKPSIEKIHNLQEMFTTEVYKFIQPAFTSWIQTSEDLYLKTILRIYGQIGETPFSHLSTTKNYWISPHKDLDDANMGLIMWFSRGIF